MWSLPGAVALWKHVLLAAQAAGDAAKYHRLQRLRVTLRT